MEEIPREELPEATPEEDLDSDDEALSFSDLLVADSALEECDSQWKYVQSPRGSPHDHFEFSRSNSMSYEQQDSAEICPADDLFYNGQLLPLSSSLRSQSRGRAFQSCGGQTNSRARDDRGYYSRTASSDSQCSSGSSFSGSNAASSRGSRSSGYSDSADRNAIITNVSFQNPNSVAPSKAEAIPCAKRPSVTGNRLKLSCRTSIKWQFFTLGLIKVPEMKLDDIRLRSSYGGMDRSPRPANPSPQPGAMEKAPATDNNNNNLESSRRNQTVPSDCKGWRIFRSIVSYRIGCRDSSGVDTVSAPRKPNKHSGSNGDNNDMVQQQGSGEIFYSAELNLRFVSDKKNCRDSPRRSPNLEGIHQTKGSVPNFISSAISLCKQCHAVEPEMAFCVDHMRSRKILRGKKTVRHVKGPVKPPCTTSPCNLFLFHVMMQHMSHLPLCERIYFICNPYLLFLGINLNVCI